MRSLIVGLGLSLVALPAVGLTPRTQTQTQTPHVLEQEHTFNKSVAAGQELRAFTYARWNRRCEGEDPPKIILGSQSSHGTVTLRPAPVTVTTIREGMPDCTGHTYGGIGVFYAPQPGFRGTDQFDYTIVDSTTQSHDTVIVDVK